MYNYKDSAFAAPTLDLERSTEYSPLTISSYNVGKTILDRSTYKGYNGQDVIISFSKNTGSNAAGSYYGGNLFKDQNANKVGYFMQIWVHLQIHHLRVGKIPMEDGNIKTLTEVM